jgi:hypothetical protein
VQGLGLVGAGVQALLQAVLVVGLLAAALGQATRAPPVTPQRAEA